MSSNLPRLTIFGEPDYSFAQTIPAYVISTPNSSTTTLTDNMSNPWDNLYLGDRPPSPDLDRLIFNGQQRRNVTATPLDEIVVNNRDNGQTIDTGAGAQFTNIPIPTQPRP
jgi:hypothetical protein